MIAPAALMYRYCHFSVSLLVEINQRRSSLFLFEQAETRFEKRNLSIIQQAGVLGKGKLVLTFPPDRIQSHIQFAEDTEIATQNT